MTETKDDEVKNLKRDLNSCKRQLKVAQEKYEKIRASVGYCELEGWKPQKRLESQYGWVYAWLYPLSAYLNENLNNPITPDVRNHIHEIVTAIIAQLAVQGKYGISLPNDPRPVDLNQFFMKQNRTLVKSYEPCEICGETRITDECHIIPRSEGGPYHRDNLVTLCPLHHHLFDHHGLSKDEWDVLSQNIKMKMEAAIIYSQNVRYPLLQSLWNRSKKSI